MTSDQFVANDQLDAQRAYLVLSGLAATALGVDPGTAGYDVWNPNTPGQHQVLSVSTGTAPQGQASTVTASLGGYNITLPQILVIGGLAWWFFSKK